MMEVMDESSLEEELDEADKALASKVPWHLVGLGVGVGAGFLLVVGLAVGVTACLLRKRKMDGWMEN